MASSQDGKCIFIAFGDCIKVYLVLGFDSKTPPDPQSIFPSSPHQTLRPTPEQTRQLLIRANSLQTPNTLSRPLFTINHIRVGWIGNQESLVAVGEFGAVLIWDLKNISRENDPIDPVLLDTSDFSSTWGIATCPNNFLVATSSNSHSITLFHYPSRKIIFSLEDTDILIQDSQIHLHTHNIPSLDFSPCGRWLISCSIDGSVALWSLAEEKVFLRNFHLNEWGWLVRFIPPFTYNLDSSSKDPVSEAKTVKTFYHSMIPSESSNEDDDDLLPDATDFNPYTDNDIDLDLDDESIPSDNEDMEIYHYEEDNDIDVENEGNLDNYFPFDGELIDGEFVDGQLIRGNFHLSEGAGDTWHLSDDNEYDYANEYGDEDDMFDYDDDDYEFDEDNCSFDFSFDSDSDDYNDNAESENSFEPKNYVTSVQIKFRKVLDDPNGLFVDSSISGGNFPNQFNFDFCYCTSRSLLIGNVSEAAEKMRIRWLKDRSLKAQGFANVSFGEGGGAEFLQNRLAMGEWIWELQVFLVIDCRSHFTLVNRNGLGRMNLLTIPDDFSSYANGNIVGYALIRCKDAEYGPKMHLYLMYEDATFKLYEIARKN